MRSGISGPRHRASNKLLPIHSAVTGDDVSLNNNSTSSSVSRNGNATSRSSLSTSSHGNSKAKRGLFLSRMATKCRNASRPFLPLVAFIFVFWIAFIMPLSQLPPVPVVPASSASSSASMPRVVPHQSQSQLQEEESPEKHIAARLAAAQDSSNTEDHDSPMNAGPALPHSPNNDKEPKSSTTGGDHGNNNDKATTNDANNNLINNGKNSGNNNRRRILSLYLESPETLDTTSIPLPRRKTTAQQLTKLEFPQASSCGSIAQEHFPVNEFPVDDPYLPWIHDYFVRKSTNDNIDNKNDNNEHDEDTTSSWHVQFVAQNKRRCETGKGKEIIMKHWEPQMSLFQPIPIRQEQVSDTNSTTTTTTIYKLSSLENATHPETRFLCQFHHDHTTTAENPTTTTTSTTTTTTSITTLSVYPFNYEFVAWRKHKSTPMWVETGRDVEKFEFSQLLFSCPIPPSIMRILQQEHQQQQQQQQESSSIWLDVIPIRTPARRDSMLLSSTIHASRNELQASNVRIFNATRQFGNNHVLPRIVDSGRWANLPICIPPSDYKGEIISLANATTTTKNNNRINNKKPPRHYFVACTWTAAAYQRRGDATTVSDSEDRLREWILFHKTVGLDHLYIYDNTDATTTTAKTTSSSNSTTATWTSPLKAVVQEFAKDDDDFVTYIPWHATVCNNNRPNHGNPGERSSQYAAEASCRERYGSETEWMAFIDTDEYLVPMMGSSNNSANGGSDSGSGTANNNTSSSSNVTLSWKPLLELKKQQGYHVLKMRSTRGRPREDLMVVPADTDAVCVPHNRRQQHLATDPCLVPRSNETFLRVYNCDYIKPPLPDRFQRAMKQIYRPAFVLSHFVHYSTITTGMARYFPETTTATNATAGGTDAADAITRELQQSDWGDVFLDDLTEGRLIHAKTVLPHETMTRNRTCYLHSKNPCIVGRVCPESTLFSDEDHTKNIFVDQQGNFCNCWINAHVEQNLIPRLEAALASHNENRHHHRRRVVVDANEAEADAAAQDPD